MNNDDFISKFFGKYGRIDPGFVPNLDKNNDNNDDKNNIFANDLHKMFQDMEEMMKTFDFGNFQVIESLDGKDPTSPKTQRENKKNLRDSFLKQDDNHSQNSEEPSPHYSQKFTFQNQSFFDKFFEMPKFDKPFESFGFEEDFRREDLLDNNQNSKRGPNVQGVFFGQSSSFRRIQRPDGSVEEIKTVKSSDGNEEKTIIRTIGDKSHTLVEKTSENGTVQETEEFFKNFNKVEEFNKDWSSLENKEASNAIVPRQNDSNLNLKRIEKLTVDTKDSLLLKLFSWFK